MKLSEAKLETFPQNPGVYRFLGIDKKILYIGKATNLRQRVRSYFDNDLIKTRGRFIVDMVAASSKIIYEECPTVLDALIREAALIKEHQPSYNTREKDNRSFAYIVITKEEYPRVLQLRERSIAIEGDEEKKYIATFGPFQSAKLAKELLSIIRRIIPFRDKCIPHSGKACFHKELGLCPGVCDDSISNKEYLKLIKDLKLLLSGKQEKLIKTWTDRMHRASKELAFEDAAKYKKIIFALTHINDITLISDETRLASQRSSRIREREFRVEAYDISHLSGTFTVGVMVAIMNGRPDTSQYRKFKIKEFDGQVDDLLRLREVLKRRFTHTEWQRPDIIVIDGGETHLRFAKNVLKELDLEIPIVSVVKDAHHKAKDILGTKDLVDSYRQSILIANMESHRFAINYHRQLRERIQK